tara:strand:- start:923 stop:1648 length:726 start_codon:yes stop_codon:yes gene_type:complete
MNIKELKKYVKHTYNVNCLLDRFGANTKLKKSSKGVYNVAGLSLMPSLKFCPMSKNAGCFDLCLKSAGRGKFNNVVNARNNKSNFYNNDYDLFIELLIHELKLHVVNCNKNKVNPSARLNVLSDIPYEKTDIFNIFEEIYFYDYTKRANRLKACNNIKNYKLMFSYSGKQEYQKQVIEALYFSNPIAVVFKNEFPKMFLNRPVFDGDLSDIDNSTKDNYIIALKAKGSLARNSFNNFVVNN